MNEQTNEQTNEQMKVASNFIFVHECMNVFLPYFHFITNTWWMSRTLIMKVGKGTNKSSMPEHYISIIQIWILGAGGGKGDTSHYIIKE